MRKTRKGFTLVELLIVVSILATLTAAMTTSISGSSGKAKASVIANNVEAMKEAAGLFYVRYMDDYDNLNVETSKMLNEMIPTWKDYGGSGSIKYTAEEDSEKGRYKWAVTVDFSKDGDKDEIIAALSQIRGYGDYNGETVTITNPNFNESEAESETNWKTKTEPAGIRVKDGAFKVTLWNGAITAVNPNS